MSEDVLSDEQVAAHKERLVHPIGVGGAIGATMTLAAKTAAAGLPLAVVYGVGCTAAYFGGIRLVDLLELQAEATRLNIATGLLAVGGLLSLYAIIQFFKRNTATRSSWLPALFALPFLLLGLGVYVIGGPVAAQMPPVKYVPVFLAAQLLWRTFFGAFAATAWILMGNQAAEGKPVDMAGGLQAASSRVVDVAAVHGGKVTAIAAGQQLIVVGIFYALQLAFADPVVVLDPERPAMRRASNLSYGMRSRIFRVLIVWFLLYTVLSGGAAIGVDGVATYQASFFDPTASSLWAWGLGDFALGLTMWLETLSLLVMYRDREAQVKAKAALRRHQKALAAGDSAS